LIPTSPKESSDDPNHPAHESSCLCRDFDKVIERGVTRLEIIKVKALGE
jgi:hypothetical protein